MCVSYARRENMNEDNNITSNENVQDCKREHTYEWTGLDALEYNRNEEESAHIRWYEVSDFSTNTFKQLAIKQCKT